MFNHKHIIKHLANSFYASLALALLSSSIYVLATNMNYTNEMSFQSDSLSIPKRGGTPPNWD